MARRRASKECGFYRFAAAYDSTRFDANRFNGRWQPIQPSPAALRRTLSAGPASPVPNGWDRQGRKRWKRQVGERRIAGRGRGIIPGRDGGIVLRLRIVRALPAVIAVIALMMMVVAGPPIAIIIVMGIGRNTASQTQQGGDRPKGTQGWGFHFFHGYLGFGSYGRILHPASDGGGGFNPFLIFWMSDPGFMRNKPNGVKFPSEPLKKDLKPATCRIRLNTQAARRWLCN